MQASVLVGRKASPDARADWSRVYQRLRAGVVGVFAAFVVFCLFRLPVEPVGNVFWAIAIATISLAPAYLWASGRVRGLPILPAHLATLVLTYGLPLVSGHPEIADAEAQAISLASASVVLYAAIVIACWYAMLLARIDGGGSFRVLPASSGYHALLAVLIAGAVYNILVIGDLITLDAGLYSLVRAIEIALTSIALFVVAVRLGGRKLSLGQKLAAAIIIGFFVVTQVATLYLGSAIVSTIVVVVGYAIGAQRVPWKSALIAVLVLGVLHAGKGYMREQYWSDYGASTSISFESLPEFVTDWLAAGLGEIGGAQEIPSQPIYERISLMHMLLLAQGKASAADDFLDGETYALIPKIFVPRFLDPDKPSVHDATNLLNLHYGLQSFLDQESTQIGWGLLAEGYANFGLAGIVGVAVVVGLFLGFVTRMTVDAPFMSIRNFIGIMILVIMVQTEFTMVVLVAATLQSVVSLLLLSPFCETRHIRGPA